MLTNGQSAANTRKETRFNDYVLRKRLPETVTDPVLLLAGEDIVCSRAKVRGDHMDPGGGVASVRVL